MYGVRHRLGTMEVGFDDAVDRFTAGASYAAGAAGVSKLRYAALGQWTAFVAAPGLRSFPLPVSCAAEKSLSAAVIPITG